MITSDNENEWTVVEDVVEDLAVEEIGEAPLVGLGHQDVADLLRHLEGPIRTFLVVDEEMTDGGADHPETGVDPGRQYRIVEEIDLRQIKVQLLLEAPLLLLVTIVPTAPDTLHLQAYQSHVLRLQ